MAMLLHPCLERDKLKRFFDILEQKAGFVAARHALIIPLLLCPMKPCVSKYHTCMGHHYSKKLGMARTIVLVGKDAYKVYFNGGAIPETLYGSWFKDAGKYYFCFSDYLNLSAEDPSNAGPRVWIPPNVVYWEDRLRKEAQAFSKFLRTTLEEGE